MDKVDVLIVGQGIAGSLLAHFLTQKSVSVAVVDNQHAFSSSAVAAGIINPITGRNFVKTWLADEAIPYAEDFYRQLGQQHGQIFLEPSPLVWLLENAKMCNDWQILSAQPHTSYFIDHNQHLDNQLLKSNFKEVEDNVVLAHSGKINLRALLSHFKTQLQAQQVYKEEKFDFQQLSISDKVRYKNIEADKIVFCEGFQAAQNPYFADLNYKFAKGEILIVQIQDYDFPQHIIKHKGLLVAPWGDNSYWVGSSYDRDFKHILPSEAAYQDLILDFEQIISKNYEIINYIAGVRPTVLDRKPYLGQHRTEKKAYIFNGLGAKGSYLAPYFAEMMSRFLVENQPLPKDVDIFRIYKKRK